MIEEPGRIDIAEIRVAHSITRFQRAKVIPLHERHYTLVASCQVRLECPGHPDRVEPLPSIVHMGETLVHVYELIVKMQNQIWRVDLGRLIGIPPVAGQQVAVEEAVALVPLRESLVQKLLG